MQVFRSTRRVFRNAAAASRVLSSAGAETFRRIDLVRRFRKAA